MMELSVNFNSKAERIAVDVDWFQIPVWATKNKYEIRTIQSTCRFEAYDPQKNIIYFPKSKEDK